MDSTQGSAASGLGGWGSGAIEDELDALRSARGGERYVPIEEIARGGMGTVLQVWDRVVQRRVAMKVLRPRPGEGSNESGDSRRTVARFLREARITGQIPHPGVVPIHDIDVRGDQVSFTMDLIEGRTFEEAFGGGGEAFDAKAGHTSRAILALISVCEVMAYAHAHDVIHRDLKPANVMVGSFGEIYVVDWGLSKVLPGIRRAPPKSESERGNLDDDYGSGVRLLGDLHTPDAGRTLDGSVVGTPSFMAPEQADGRVDEVGPLADVYATGAILYRVLTGRNPYTSPGQKNDPATIIQLVRRGPPTPVLKLNPKAPAELVSICEQAMARDPGQRYASMSEMADDLRAFLDGRVVAAYEEGPIAGFKKLVLRNRALATSIAATVLSIAGAMVVVTLVHARVNHQLEDKNEQLELARAAAEQNAKQAQREAAEAERQRVLAERGNYAARVSNAAERLGQGDLATARSKLAGLPPGLRGWESEYLSSRLEGSLAIWRRAASDSPEALARPTAVASNQDGTELAIGFADGHLSVREASSGRELAAAELGTGAILALGRHGEGWLALFADALVTWHAGRAERHLLELGRVTCAASAAGGAYVGTEQGAVLSIAPDAGGRWSAVERARVDGPLAALAFGAGGSIAAADSNGTVHVWREQGEAFGDELALERGEQLAAITSLAIDAEGELVAAGDESGTVWVHSRSDGGLVWTDRGLRAGVTVLSAGRQGGCFLAGGADGSLVALSAGEPAVELDGHEDRILAIAPLGTTERLLSASRDGTARLWDGRGLGAMVRLDGLGTAPAAAAFDPSGRSIAVGAADGFLLSYETRLGGPLDQVACGGVVCDVAWLADGRIAAALVGAPLDWLRATGQGWIEDEGPAPAGAREAALVRSAGQTLALAFDDGSLAWGTPSAGAPLTELEGEGSPPVCLDLDAGGRWLAAAFADGRIRLVDLASGAERKLALTAASTVQSLALHPDGEQLAWGDESGQLGTIPLAPGAASSWVVSANARPVTAVVWIDGGARLVSGSADGTARVFWPPLEEPLLVLDHGQVTVADLGFDEGARRLAVVCAATGAGSEYDERDGVYLYGPLPPDLVLPDRSGEDDPSLRGRSERTRGFHAAQLSLRAWDELVRPDSSEERYERAYELVKRLALIDSERADSSSLTGAALLRLGKPEQALAALLESQRTGSEEDARTRALTGLALLALGRTGEARASREALGDAEPDRYARALCEELARKLVEPTSVDPSQAEPRTESR